VVEVAPHHLLQRALDTLLNRLAQVQLLRVHGALEIERAPGRYLRPHQQAHLVGKVEVQRVGRLDVAAQVVQAKLLGLGELVAQVLLRGHRVDRVGVHVLVEGRQ
jgi:hypothetical protein